MVGSILEEFYFRGVLGNYLGPVGKDRNRGINPYPEQIRGIH
jgi:hypothetical protein